MLSLVSPTNVDGQSTGGWWIQAQVKGYPVDLSVALTGVAEEISIPVGAFYKVPS